MISDALRAIMDAVDDLSSTDDPLVRNTKRSLIAFKVALLTGDQPQQVFAALREPCAPLKVPSHQRAVKAPKGETLDQVVEQVAERLRLVPVNTEVGGGEVPWVEEAGT